MWDRRLEILGTVVKLDHLNYNIGNVASLPRVLVTRRVIWGEGEDRQVRDEHHVEAFFTDTHYGRRFVADVAEHDVQNVWTLVELHWYSDCAENGPRTGDIIVWKDGVSENEYQRRRKAVGG